MLCYGSNDHQTMYILYHYIFCKEQIYFTTGSESQRKSEIRKWSKYTYEYLRRHLGDENLVKARRILMDNQFSCMGRKADSMMPSGSKAEGLDIKTSDLDIMSIEGLAHEIDGETFIKEGYLYDSTSDECNPGYTFISMVSNSVIARSVGSDEFRSAMKFNKQCIPYFVEDHGPSLSLSLGCNDFDVAHCLETQEWPRIACEWKYRKRWFEWPDFDTVSLISQSGCHIVPKGRMKHSFQTEQWRLSFSKAENVLIRSFNHTQFMVYGGLKILFQEAYIEMRHAYKDFISSYVLKTALFWVSEENEIAIWYPENTLYCMILCLDRVEKWIQEINCPNYFVRVNNMFCDKYPVESIPELLHIVSVVKRNMLRFIWQCEILKHSSVELNYVSTCQKTEENIVICCLNFIAFSKGLVCGLASVSSSNAERWSIVNEIFHCRLPKQVKQMLYPFFSHFIGDNVESYSNKKMYYFNKLYLKYILCCNKMEMIGAKVNMASWFYKQQRYNDALVVLDLILQRLKFASYYSSEQIIHIDTPEGIIVRQHASVMEKMKFTLEMIIIPKGSMLVPCELHAFFDISHSVVPFVAINPMTYCNVLKFLCFHRKGLVNERTVSLIDLQNVQYFGRDIEIRANKRVSRLLLIICLIIENRNDSSIDIDSLIRDADDDTPPDIFEYAGMKMDYVPIDD